jgi:tRNA-binding EMAP/Myf-like protein
VIDVEAIPKTKLKALKLALSSSDPDAEGNTITVVTNAKNVNEPGLKVVVACIGAVVSADGEEVVVKRSTVGGRKSEGILCDAPMLKWKGGGTGNAVILVGDEFVVGDSPPNSKPRTN